MCQAFLKQLNQRTIVVRMPIFSKLKRIEQDKMHSKNQYWCNFCSKYKFKDLYKSHPNNKYGINNKCKECDSLYKAKHYLKNRERLLDRQKQYQSERILTLKQIDNIKSYDKQWKQNKRQNDPSFKLYENFSRSMRSSLKENKSGRSWEFLVGYTIDDLKSHLSDLFQDGMSFDNHGIGEGKWNIDHKIPLKFKNDDGSYYWNQKELENPNSKTFKECWALSNLQPKWSIPNIKKGNRFKD